MDSNTYLPLLLLLGVIALAVILAFLLKYLFHKTAKEVVQTHKETSHQVQDSYRKLTPEQKQQLKERGMRAAELLAKRYFGEQKLNKFQENMEYILDGKPMKNAAAPPPPPPKPSKPSNLYVGDKDE